MKRSLFIVLFFCVLAFAQGKPACPDPLTAVGRGKDDKAAILDANATIAMQIKSRIKVGTDISHSQREIDGVPTDDNRFSETVSMEAEFERTGAIKNIAPPKLNKASGLYEVERYICPKDAAKPSLDSLGRLADDLESFAKEIEWESCKKINNIYHNKIVGFESLVEGLGQANEHKSRYLQAREKCRQIGKGLFLDENSDVDDILVEMIETTVPTTKFRGKSSDCGPGGVLVKLKQEKISTNNNKVDSKYRINFNIGGMKCDTKSGLRGIAAYVEGSDENEARNNLRKTDKIRCSSACKGGFKMHLKKTFEEWMAEE